MDERNGMGVVEESGEEEGERIRGGKGCEGRVHRLRESDEEEKGCERAGLEEEKGCERRKRRVCKRVWLEEEKGCEREGFGEERGVRRWGWRLERRGV